MRFLHIALLLLLPAVALAQRASIQPEAREIEGLRRQGMGVLLEYDRKTCEKAWQRQLKVFGKVDTWKGGAIVVLASAQSAPDFAGQDVISQLIATAEGTRLFLAIGKAGDYAAAGSPEYERGKRLLQDFARQLARDDLAEQIAAAERELEVSGRTHDKTIAIGEQLKRSLERNTQDQADLARQMEAKKTEAERLKTDMAQNKTDQEAMLDQIKKVRKIAEDKRAKLAQTQNQ